jgi:NADH-quinone oxidoreductase subunit G
MASTQLFAAVPLYAGLTLDVIGGRGVRWPATEGGAAFAVAPWEPVRLDVPPAAPSPNGALRLGTFRSLWTSKEVEVSPALAFVRPAQVIELSPSDAHRLGIGEGDRVEVGSNGHRVRGAVRLRAAIPAGSVFVAEGTREEPGNLLTEAMVQVRRVGAPETPVPSGVPTQVAPAAEGYAEAPPSAPLDLPPTPGISSSQREEGSG